MPGRLYKVFNENVLQGFVTFLPTKGHSLHNEYFDMGFVKALLDA